VAIAGDSSGGNLAAAVSLLLREGGQPGPVGQLLIYPALDLTLAACAASLRQFGRGYWLTAEDMQLLVSYYTPNESDRHDRLASPLLAPPTGNMPPTLVANAAFDPIRDDGEAYAAWLVSGGGSVTHLRFGTMIHGFIEFAPIIPAAREARLRIFHTFAGLLSGVGSKA
jgi:acetyl esterase